MKERVIHPLHYNSHPTGVECIEIIRHYCFDIGCAIKYLWRAGLKTEDGMSDIAKEIEDLRKAVFYIDDFAAHLPVSWYKHELTHPSGMDVDKITFHYDIRIGSAIDYLWWCGVIIHGQVYVPSDAPQRLLWAKRSILARVDELSKRNTQ